MADQPNRVLQRYDHFRGPQRLGDVWTLHRGAIALRCSLATHSLGWELRLTAGSAFSRSQVCKSEREVFDLRDGWKAEALAKGWT